MTLRRQEAQNVHSVDVSFAIDQKTKFFVAPGELAMGFAKVSLRALCSASHHERAQHGSRPVGNGS